MFHNRIREFDMGSGEQQNDAFGQPLPRRVPQVMHVPQPMHAPVTTADIFQAAARQAMEEYQLNRLFNPEYYDYEI